MPDAFLSNNKLANARRGHPRPRRTHRSPAAAQPPGLSVELREYQLQSLHRMRQLEAESGGLRDALWRTVPSLPGVWFSPVYRLLLPEAQVPPLSKGGFLCEEMGLGKTVEMCALVLANPYTPQASAAGRARPRRGGYEARAGAGGCASWPSWLRGGWSRRGGPGSLRRPGENTYFTSTLGFLLKCLQYSRSKNHTTIVILLSG